MELNPANRSKLSHLNNHGNGIAQIIKRAFLGWQTEHTFNEITLVNVKAKFLYYGIHSQVKWSSLLKNELNLILDCRRKVTIKKVTDDRLALPMITQNIRYMQIYINYCDGFFCTNISHLCFIRFTSLDPFESLKTIFFVLLFCLYSDANLSFETFARKCKIMFCLQFFPAI